MTAPAQRAAPTVTVGSSATSITFTDGDAGTTAANDIIVAIIYVEANLAITPAAGWSSTFNGTVLEQALSTPSTWSAHAYWIRRGGSAPAYNFTWTGGNYSQGGICSYTGAVTSGDPWSFGAETQRNDGASRLFPDVSGTTDSVDELLIWTGMNFVGSTAMTQPTGFTGRATAGGNDVYWADKTEAVAGLKTATGASWTVAPADNASSMLMGLRSVAAGGATATYPYRRRPRGITYR